MDTINLNELSTKELIKLVRKIHKTYNKEISRLNFEITMSHKREEDCKDIIGKHKEYLEQAECKTLFYEKQLTMSHKREEDLCEDIENYKEQLKKDNGVSEHLTVESLMAGFHNKMAELNAAEFEKRTGIKAQPVGSTFQTVPVPEPEPEPEPETEPEPEIFSDNIPSPPPKPAVPTFLFDTVAQDIEDKIVEEKKYMDHKYIRKCLKKQEIRDGIDEEASKHNRRFTNMDKANIDRLFKIIEDKMVPSTLFNPRGLNYGEYLSYLYKEDCVNAEAIQKPGEDLKHKWKVGDILYKRNKEYSEPTQFWRVVKLTKKSYTLEWVQNNQYQDNDGPYWIHYYTEIDLDNPVAPGGYTKYSKWEEVKLARNVKEDNYYLVEDLMKPDNQNKYLITVEGRKVKSKYYTLDLMR